MHARVVTLHDEAGRDYDAAFEWYLERTADAAVRFDDAVQRAMGEIAMAPQRWLRGPYGTPAFLDTWLSIFVDLSRAE